MTTCLLTCGIATGAAAGGNAVADLRFYGHVSSESRELGGGVADFVVTAESEEKAKLWHAKFLSDLMCEGVAARRGCAADGTEGLYEVPGGWMAGARAGSRVHLLHAPTAEALRSACGGLGSTQAETAVPMALDALEKYAFRFYYQLGARPEGASFYDEAENIEFCRANGLGLVFWTGPHLADTAAGVLSDGQWGYLLDRARRSGVPVCLNFNCAELPVRDFFAPDMDTRQPGYMGGFVRFGGPIYGGAGHLSIDHPAANAHQYAGIQEILRRYDTENVISLHEVNGELRHGDHNIFLNYGPEADRSFRSFLEKRHGREFPGAHYPEVAEFAGYGPDAQDLAGAWRIRYDDAEDGAWGTTPVMPGDDRALFLPRKPATLERDFDYGGTGRTWLYLWDLNKVHKAPVEIALNGQVVRREEIRFNTSHWTYVEVTDALRRGANTISLKLPWGIIGYKVYLTHEEPKFFPFASPEMNRLWVDSVDWNTERRLATITDSMNAMRAIDPDKSVVLMNPRAYSRQLREVARLRGGRFHDTGGMGACEEESEPMLMRGANLPFTLEPGGPAKDANGFLRLVGLWMAQGINAIHYFIHVGDVLWHPDIKAEFLRVLPALRMLGKSRQVQGDVAMVIDSDVDKYFGYPWCEGDYNLAFPSGYWAWRFNINLSRYPMDALIPDDFGNGLADRYKVVIDCNNSIISRSGVDAIRRWVEKGGTYIAMFQSGRHSFEGADKWELQSLTGFRGKVFAHYGPDGAIDPGSYDRMLRTPEGAVRLPTLAESVRATGTSLEPVAPDAVALATWKAAGGVAVGWRKVGRGEVYTFGVQLSRYGQGHGVWFPELVDAILKSRGVGTKGFAAAVKGGQLRCRHFVSNNGLYDVWYVWNADGREGAFADYSIKFEDGREREVQDVLTGRPLPLEGKIPPSGFVMGVSPRLDTRDAAAHWFYRQCGDNQGTLAEPFAEPDDGYGANTCDISGGWAVNGVSDVRLGVWEKGVQPGVVSNSIVATRKFEAPAGWEDGTVYLSHTGMNDSGIFSLSAKNRRGEGLRVFLDGLPLGDIPSDRGFSLVPLQGLAAGSSHELRLELTTSPEGRFTGTRGATFLTFVPSPKRKVALGGWKGEGRFLELAAGLEPFGLADGERVVFHQDGARGVEGVIVNGKYVRRHHHLFGDVVNLDVTAFLKPGLNEFVLVTRGWKVTYPQPELHIAESPASRRKSRLPEK